MSKQIAVYYGQVEIIPGIICDGYILNNGTAVMSERGTADLLGMAHPALRNMVTTGVPKTLKPFIDKSLSMVTTPVQVEAKNCPYKGRKIVVYGSHIIEGIIRAYAMAIGYNSLQKNQLHIGRRCVLLFCSLAKTALELAIKEACGFKTEIQKTIQKHYVDAVELIQEFGFTCSVSNNIATKQDIISFLKIPKNTLNSFLYKHKDEIKPTRLDISTIRSLGKKANRLNGYHLDEVAKIAFGMDTEIGIELKKRMFVHIGKFANPYTKEEIQWRKILAKIFQGFDLRYNYFVGKYRVDFFVATMGLCLECNGYDCHRYYDPKEEKKRETAILKKYSLIRFHHQISLETLFNGILQAKKGQVIKLYNISMENICNN